MRAPRHRSYPPSALPPALIGHRTKRLPALEGPKPAKAALTQDLRVLIARLDSDLSAMPSGESRQMASVFAIGPRAATPQAGDILIKGLTTDSFALVEIITGDFLLGPIHGFPAALAAARARHPRAIWQQHSDERGRPLADPFRLPNL